jgi:uncharacterized phage protein (TIGR01671 family)
MDRPLKFKAFDRVLKKWTGFFPHMLKDGTCEIVQYIGRCDKNMKEIYEGDILKIKNTTANSRFHDEYWHGVVEYDDGIFAFVAQGIKYDYSAFLVDEDIEVVGSIFEMSPELAEILK